jgi:AcrR family transcriptional regulator
LSNDKKTAILRAAEHMVKGRRFHEVTMEDVARAAGVSKGTIYTYFRDKNELFFQLATEGLDRFCELLDDRIPEDVPFDDKLLSTCREISAFFVKRKPLMRVMLEHEGRTASFHRQMRSRWKEKRLRMVQAVAGILELGVAGGQIRSDVPAAALAELLLGMLRARGRRMHQEGEELLSIENVVEVFLHGAGNTGGS